MMRLRHVGWCALVLVLSLVGCQKDPLEGVKLVPVTGTVRVQGKPLQQGVLSFRPDVSKGNTSPYEPAGSVDEHGVYVLKTEGKAGAPAGWYKVLLVSAEKHDPKEPYAPRKSYVDRKYGSLQTTDLRVEVVESAGPGAYDLEVNP